MYYLNEYSTCTLTVCKYINQYSMSTIYIYIYIYKVGESIRLPTPYRISVTIIDIKKLYIHELLVI